MGKISKKFNWLLILAVSLSVFITSLATTTYLIYVSEKNTHEKNNIQIKGLVNNIHEYLNNAYTLNYQLSINPLIINQVLSSKKDWFERVTDYNSRFDTSGEIGIKSGPIILTKVQSDYDFVDLIYLQDLLGNQVGKSYGQIGKRGDRWWFKEFMGSRGMLPFISKSYYSLTGDKPVASIFHPVYNNEQLLGILGIDIVFSELQKIVESYLNTEDMYAIVVDTEGVIIAHPDKNILSEIYNLSNLTKQVLKHDVSGNSIMDKEGNHVTEIVSLDWAPEISKAVKDSLNGNNGYIKGLILNGVKSTVYFDAVSLPSDKSGLENYGVLLIQGVTTVEKAKKVILLSTLLLIIITITLLSIIFRIRFRKFIITPLQTLIDSMNNVDIDNFQIIELHTNDEFSLMAKTYNDLRINLFNAKGQLLEKIEILKEREDGYKTLSEIGLALSVEDEIEDLLEVILDEAMRMTRSDGGTLYLHDKENKQLTFDIVHNETLNIRYSPKMHEKPNFPPVPLYVNGEPNYSNVSSFSALTGKIVNIPDVYKADGFDFSGMRKYDKKSGYHSISMLVIPMLNRDKELIGVLQLINSRKKENYEIIPFSEVYEDLTSSMAYQAAVKMTNIFLYNKIRTLLHSVIKSIASAIDEKSAFTGKHISNVYRLTMMIAKEINSSNEGKFKETYFSNDELEELRLSAWMHDIGKITTPESVLNKETKLQFFDDEIKVIETRFNLIQVLFKYDSLLQKQEDNNSSSRIEEELKLNIEKLRDDYSFICRCNDPENSITLENIESLKKIASKTYFISGESHPYLTDREVENLSIVQGTLNTEEREIIKDHIRMTKVILEQISFPDNVSKVAEYASMHHEKLNGSGYPRNLLGDEIPMQARIIAIADIFEALSAKERPYRKPNTLEEVLKILDCMKNDNQIDSDICDLVVNSHIAENYFKTI